MTLHITNQQNNYERKHYIKTAYSQEVIAKIGAETLKQIYLPTEYISKQRYILPNKFETFVIFAQIQRYKLSNETTNNRETYSVILGRFTTQTPDVAEVWYYNSFNEAEEVAKTWVANAGIELTDSLSFNYIAMM